MSYCTCTGAKDSVISYGEVISYCEVISYGEVISHGEVISYGNSLFDIAKVHNALK